MTISKQFERNGGEWSDDTMACNDFETFGDQDNFIDKLMDRTTYDALEVNAIFTKVHGVTKRLTVF